MFMCVYVYVCVCVCACACIHISVNIRREKVSCQPLCRGRPHSQRHCLPVCIYTEFGFVSACVCASTFSNSRAHCGTKR